MQENAGMLTYEFSKDLFHEQNIPVATIETSKNTTFSIHTKNGKIALNTLIKAKVTF